MNSLAVFRLVCRTALQLRENGPAILQKQAGVKLGLILGRLGLCRRLPYSKFCKFWRGVYRLEDEVLALAARTFLVLTKESLVLTDDLFSFDEESLDVLDRHFPLTGALSWLELDADHVHEAIVLLIESDVAYFDRFGILMVSPLFWWLTAPRGHPKAAIALYEKALQGGLVEVRSPDQVPVGFNLLTQVKPPLMNVVDGTLAFRTLNTEHPDPLVEVIIFHIRRGSLNHDLHGHEIRILKEWKLWD